MGLMPVFIARDRFGKARSEVRSLRTRPTSDISPRTTFTSCGNSSRCVALAICLVQSTRRVPPSTACPRPAGDGPQLRDLHDPSGAGHPCLPKRHRPAAAQHHSDHEYEQHRRECDQQRRADDEIECAFDHSAGQSQAAAPQRNERNAPYFIQAARLESWRPARTSAAPRTLPLGGGWRAAPTRGSRRFRQANSR